MYKVLLFVGSIFIIVAVIAGVFTLVSKSDASPAQSTSLVGSWHGDMFDAEVTNGSIEVRWSDKSNLDALYWKGTFVTGTVIGDAEFTSEGDTDMMDNSLLASMDKTKKFTYKDGKLQFLFTVMGAVQVCTLSR